MRENLITFEKENEQNEYIDFSKKMKPRIFYDSDLTAEEIHSLKQTVKNTLPHIQKLIYRQYLNEENKDSLASDGDWFPDRTKMTGNYYIGDVSYYKGYQIIMEIRMTSFE